MTARILLFGATGYTGDLTARSLVRQGARPVLVARSAERVQALATELGGLETVVADVSRPASVIDAVQPGDVLISTVGPFLRFGEPAVRAAVEKGAHYFDSTGEGPFIREVFERWGPVAASHGVGLLSAFGFDYVPGNLAAALALAQAGPEATAVDVGYFPVGFKTSGGTNASIAGMMLEDGFALREGRVQVERAGRRRRTFDVAGKSLTGVSLPGSEHFGLAAIHPTLREVGVFLGVPPAAARVMATSTALSTPIRKSAAVRALGGKAAARFVKGSTGGPDAASRARSTHTMVAEARSSTGQVLATVTMTGPDPYDFTADILAWGAIRAAGSGMLASGGLGPVEAFGLDGLTQGCASVGLKRV
ncbi:MAG: saccharopine dehydrogenase NADP-binding domain-containing protein [Propionibacteriales bacterium]|nr:saccharopine dehydrogenase NADP-binding domain-containing protein [Propionibacteriales bacterium]